LRFITKGFELIFDYAEILRQFRLSYQHFAAQQVQLFLITVYLEDTCVWLGVRISCNVYYEWQPNKFCFS